MSDIIELAQFKTKVGVAEGDFLEASEPVGVWIKQQPGFRYRSLARDEHGQWRDVVYWASHAHAAQASEAFMAAFGTSEFMALIDEQSLNMSHSQVRQMQTSDAG